MVETRESVLQYVADVVQKNASRGQIQVKFCANLECLSMLHFITSSLLEYVYNSHCHSRGLLLQANPFTTASNGMFVNLSAVMLKLCEPFLDASHSKKEKIDARYVLQGGRPGFR